MDININDAKLYLRKINRLFEDFVEDQGHLSAIERDLMLDYVRKFYEAIVNDKAIATAPTVVKTEPKTILPKEPVQTIVAAPKVETPAIESVQEVVKEAPKVASRSVDLPIKEIPSVEPKANLEQPEVKIPVVATTIRKVVTPTPKPIEVINEVEVPKVEEQPTPAVPVQPIQPVQPETWSQPEIKTPELPAEPEASPQVSETPFTQKAIVETPSVVEDYDAYDVLFEEAKVQDLSQKLSQTKVSNLRSAMGINERFLIQNELFGGNSSRFNDAIDELNSFDNFLQAKAYIIKFLAPENDWINEKRVKRAQSFVQKIRRRYL